MSTEGMLLENALRTPRSSKGVFELPCGYLKDTEHGLLLYKEVELRGMSGDEEDLLASRQIAFDKKMSALLASMIVRLSAVPWNSKDPEGETEQVHHEEGPDITDRREIRRVVDELLLGDRTFLFFAIRRVSLGDEFPFKEKCPKCEQTSVQPFDLSRLDVRNMPNPKQRTYSIETPDGHIVEYRCMSGREEKERDRLKKTMPAPSLAVYLRVISIDGADPTPFSVKRMSLRDRDFLRGQFALADGGVETTIELSCPLCGHDFQRELDPGQPSFFSPSATSAIWKRKSST